MLLTLQAEDQNFDHANSADLYCLLLACCKNLPLLRVSPGIKNDTTVITTILNNSLKQYCKPHHRKASWEIGLPPLRDV